MEAERRREEMRVMQKAINNPLIAEEIFKQAEFADKKNIRLISRFWRDATLEEWRSKSAAIHIVFPDKHYFANDRWSNYMENLPVQIFERMMEGRQKTAKTHWPAPFRLQKKPFRNVALSGGNFSLPPCGGKRLPKNVADVEDEFKLFKFLDKFGSQFTSLWLYRCKMSRDSYVHGMKWITKRCPGLKELNLLFESTNAPERSSSEVMTDFSTQSLNTPGQEISKLSRLNINHSCGCIPEPYDLQIGNDNMYIKEEDILSAFPNLKSLKFSETDFHLPIEKSLSVPMSNGKYLDLEELDLQISVLNSDGPYWTHKKSIEGLNRYIELTRPSSFKKFRIEFDFTGNCEEIDDVIIHSYMDDVIDQFFNKKGHLLTHLEIELGKPFEWHEPQLVSHLTGYQFSNLTHLTIFYKYTDNRSCGRGPAGSLYFDFEALQGMPKLQVFHCLDHVEGNEGDYTIPLVNLPIELNDLKEFTFSCKDKFTKESLRMILGWMKGVQRLALYLDKETFPVVFEMAPQLDRLILLGKEDGLTLAEEETGEFWIGFVEREKQEMEWRRKMEEQLRQNVAKISRKKAKENARKEKRKLEREKKRVEIEKEEKEWIAKQEEDGESWTFVSYRHPIGRSKNEMVKPEPTEPFYFPPRQSNGNGPPCEFVDDFTVFCKLREIMKTGNVRIFRTRGVYGIIHDMFDKHNFTEDVTKLVEYKIGGLE